MRAVIDIDNTLFCMAELWYKELIKVNSSCPFPGEGVWEFYKGYLTEEEFAATVKAVHLKQHEYDVFENANLLTRMLKERGYEVIIASHRDPDTTASTMKWLDKHNIYYDELYTGFNKLFLLDEPTEIFIDDCPLSQEEAVKKGIKTFSIMYPYNKHIEGVSFYKDFKSMLCGVKRWTGERLGLPVCDGSKCKCSSM